MCALARANENDIRRAGEALRPAKSMRIHTFIASSPIHMQMKLRMTPDQVFEQAMQGDRLGARIHGQRRVLAGGRGALGARLPVPAARGGDRRGRDDDQHSRHRRLHDAVAVRRADRIAARAHSEFRQGRVVGALPQRSRPRRRELARGGDARRAPGRMHDQRPRRARRQCVARGNRHGGAHAQGRVPVRRRASMRRRSSRRRSSCPASPAFPCSRTRRSSAPMRSRTSPAFTRTAC